MWGTEYENETEIETKKRVFLNMPKASGHIHEFQMVANYILFISNKM